MQKIIYFGNKPLVLSNPITASESRFEPYDNVLIETSFTDDKIEKIIAGIQQPEVDGAIIEHTSTDELLEAFKNKMVVIQAGGGLVHTDDKKVLLIFRRGKWDLPKGKLDEGETLEACAIREVEEETGLHDIKLQKPLTPTWHTYYQDRQLVLKESHWYLMRVEEEQQPVPQQEEDIESCLWVPLNDLQDYKTAMQPSVLDVLKVAEKEL